MFLKLYAKFCSLESKYNKKYLEIFYFFTEDQSSEVMTSKLTVQADVHNTSAISGGSGSSVQSDISDIIPKDILADIGLDKSDPTYTSMLTDKLMKIQAKEEEERLFHLEAKQKEARQKAQEI